MTPTPTSDVALDAPVNPSPEKTPEWLYNELMRFINPDLMTDRLPLLSMKYSGESEAEKNARLRSYEEAFAVFDHLAVTFTGPIAEAGRAEMRARQQELRMQEGKESAAALETIEESLLTSDE